MIKRVVVKISLNPMHPADAALIKRLHAIEGNMKSTHLRLAAFHYFGILDELVKANNPHSKEHLSAGIGMRTGNFNNNDQKREDSLDGSSIFASAFDNI